MTIFDQPLKNLTRSIWKACRNVKIETVEIVDDYISGSVLDYMHHQNYKLIGIDLLRKTNASFLQQINFIGKLEEDVATMFFIMKSNKKLFSTY